MKFYFIDGVFVISLIILFWGMKFEKPFTKVNKDYLAVKNCNAMRGYFSLMPLLVHIANCTRYSNFTGWFTTNGNAIVGGFFFFTGFGLMKQYMKKDDYDRGFLIKRLPKVLIPYIVTTVIYQVADFFLMGFLYMPGDILHAIACGDPIVLYSWYIIHVLAFYLVFYLLMKLCRKHYSLMILGAFIYYVLTAILFVQRGFGMHWYQTSLALPIGMAFAVYESGLYKFFSKYYYICTAALLAVTFVIYNYGFEVFYRLFPENFHIHNVCVSTLMLLCIIVAMMKIEFGNKILHFLGNISFETYLLHGLVIMIAKNLNFTAGNDMVFAIFVIVVTIIAATGFKYCIDYGFKIWDKVMDRLHLIKG